MRGSCASIGRSEYCYCSGRCWGALGWPALGAFALVLFMHRLAILLSFVGAALAASYPFMKRWTHLPQFYLGAAFGWGVPMAFAAQTGSVPVDAGLLVGGTVCWAVAYDTAYAMVDRED